MANVDVAIIVGSKSDWAHAEKALEMIKKFGLKSEAHVISAHRMPDRLREYVRSSHAKVFIAMAGLAAHLPGVIASYTTRPVIGVPLNAKLNGLDSLLSTLEMPRGVPVACVAIDGAENAVILAAEILAINDERLAKKLAEFREELSQG